jgi:hypothetical protein
MEPLSTSERGITVTYQHSDNEVIYCLFHTHAGTTVPVRRAALESALPELVQLGFLRELERSYSCIKYRLVEGAI